MSKIALTPNASGTGVFTIASPNSNTDRTLTLPDEAGTLVTTSSLPNPLTSGIAIASTSGTAIDFTGLPSWVKRITVMFSAVSTNGSSGIRFQLGDSGGIETTGYTGTATYIGSAVGGADSTSGFDGYGDTNAVFSRFGNFVFTLLASNTWTLTGSYRYTTGFAILVYGAKQLSDTLTQVRITTPNGTDTFDAGSINILYE